MKELLIILTAITLFSCNENYYNKEIIGNKMIITERFEDKIGTFVREYERIEVLNLFSIMTGNMIELPGLLRYKFTEPEKWYIFYPCFFYQAWFWTQYTGLI